MVLQDVNPKVGRLIDSLKGKEMVKVLFVCLGNICRSPAAEGVLQAIVDEHHAAERWLVDSAGTGNYHIGSLPDPRMRAHARRRGLELTHRCRQVSVSDFEEFDMIVAMDSSNEYNLRELAPSVEAEEKIVAMSAFFSLATRYDYVPDPYYEGAEGFELVLDLLDDACLNLYDTVTAAVWGTK